jgi:hypothetical protein
MGRESNKLAEARRCLARAEAGLRSADGVARLVDGVALLDDIASAGTAEAATARNLAATYAARIYAEAQALLADPQLPEPELEQLFRAVIAFDPFAASLPHAANDVKIEIARRLIDRYYEGHSPERKLEAFQELTKLARGR